ARDAPRRRATFFVIISWSEFFADHPVDRTAPGSPKEDRGINEQQEHRIFIAAVRAGKANSHCPRAMKVMTMNSIVSISAMGRVKKPIASAAPPKNSRMPIK